MGSMMKQTRISELAAIISEQTAVVDDYLKSQNLPTLSFDVDASANVPIPTHETGVVAAQAKVIASTQELHDLMKGPTELLLGASITGPNNALSLQAVYHYKIATIIPPDSTRTYAELSKACGLNEIELRRLLRHAMTNHIFQESDGGVAHTAASRILAENTMTRDIVGIMCEEMFPGASRTVDALDKWNGARAPNESGYSLAHNTDGGLYDVLSQHPERGRRFANAMSGFAQRTGIDALAQGFDWKSVSSVVDVGGGRGEVCIGLAERFAHLSFTVQDLKHVIEEAPGFASDEMRKRVEWKEHDYFSVQDTMGKDVYYFRYILHNLPDESCVKLLKAQVPALKRGAHIIIQDAVIPEENSEGRSELSLYQEKYQRSMDLVMLTFFGARERTLREWKDIVEKADGQLEIRYESATGSSSDILDIVWKETVEQTTNL